MKETRFLEIEKHIDEKRGSFSCCLFLTQMSSFVSKVKTIVQGIVLGNIARALYDKNLATRSDIPNHSVLHVCYCKIKESLSYVCPKVTSIMIAINDRFAGRVQ
jgi:hypothetical protein